MATHSSILAWKIPWTEEPGGLVYGVAKSHTQLRDEAQHTHCQCRGRGFDPWSRKIPQVRGGN